MRRSDTQHLEVCPRAAAVVIAELTVANDWAAIRADPSSTKWLP